MTTDPDWPMSDGQIQNIAKKIGMDVEDFDQLIDLLDNEDVQDNIAGALQAGAGIDISYDDPADQITISVIGGSLNPEEVEDIVGGLVSGGDKINAQYDDANDTLTINTSALDEQEVKSLSLDEGEAKTLIRNFLVGASATTVTYDAANDEVVIETKSSDIEANQLAPGTPEPDADQLLGYDGNEMFWTNATQSIVEFESESDLPSPTNGTITLDSDKVYRPVGRVTITTPVDSTGNLVSFRGMGSEAEFGPKDVIEVDVSGTFYGETNGSFEARDVEFDVRSGSQLVGISGDGSNRLEPALEMRSCNVQGTGVFGQLTGDSATSPTGIIRLIDCTVDLTAETSNVLSIVAVSCDTEADPLFVLNNTTAFFGLSSCASVHTSTNYQLVVNNGTLSKAVLNDFTYPFASPPSNPFNSISPSDTDVTFRNVEGENDSGFGVDSDIAFPNIGGQPTFGTHDHTESGMSPPVANQLDPGTPEPSADQLLGYDGNAMFWTNATQSIVEFESESDLPSPTNGTITLDSTKVYRPVGQVNLTTPLEPSNRSLTFFGFSAQDRIAIDLGGGALIDESDMSLRTYNIGMNIASGDEFFNITGGTNFGFVFMQETTVSGDGDLGTFSHTNGRMVLPQPAINNTINVGDADAIFGINVVGGADPLFNITGSVTGISLTDIKFIQSPGTLIDNQGTIQRARIVGVDYFTSPPSDPLINLGPTDSGIQIRDFEGVADSGFSVAENVSVLNDSELEDGSGNSFFRINDGGNLDILRTMNFPNITGTPTFADHDHTEDGMSSITPKRSTEVPMTQLQDAEIATGLRVQVPNGKTLEVLEVGLQDDTGSVPSGVNIEVYDHGAGLALVSQNTAHNTGSPINSVSGATSVSIRLNNGSGGQVTVSGHVVYTLT